MQETALLRKEVNELRGGNEKKKQKMTRSTRQITSNESLSALEASQLIIQPEPAILALRPPITRPDPEPSQPRRRALPTCSACKDQGHKSNACPNKPRS